MPYRDLDPTPAEKTASPNALESEVEAPPRRTTSRNLWTGLGGPPAEAGNALRKSTNGRLSRAGNTLLQLQHQYGNQYVQRLINPQQRTTVQPKLMLGDVNTPSEQEADRFSQAINSGQPLNAAPTPVSGPMMPVTSQTESAINQARGGGQSLPENTQTQMSQNLGADLSGVRVHTDSRADSLNQSLQAKAFTTGQDIFFRRGAYSPGSSGGQQLLAHELTHVVQQQGRSVIQRKIYATSSNVGKKEISPKAAYEYLLWVGVPNRIASALTKWYSQPNENITLGDLVRKAKMAANQEASSSVSEDFEEPENVPDPLPAPQREEEPEPQPQLPAHSKQARKRQWIIEAQKATEERAKLRKEMQLEKKKGAFDHRTYISNENIRRNAENFFDDPQTMSDTKKRVAEALEAKELSYLEKIPIEDLAAVNYYQGSGYGKMNKNLRSGKGKKEDVLLAASGLNQLPPVEGTVYRGVKLSFEDAESFGYLNIGGIHTEKSFMSTTIDKRYWAPSKFSDGTVAFQIESKGGAKDLRAIAPTGVEAEDELIFTPYTQFKVLGITPSVEKISEDNEDKFPFKPTITIPVKADELKKKYQGMAIYLEERPSSQQKEIYKRLDKQYGTVNINRAIEMSKLLELIYCNLYGDDPRPELNVINKYAEYVLPAVKQISIDPELSELVSNKLKARKVAGLEDLQEKPPIIKTLLTRWEEFIKIVRDDVKEQADVEAAERAKIAAEREAEEVRIAEKAARLREFAKSIPSEVQNVLDDTTFINKVRELPPDKRDNKKALKQILESLDYDKKMSYVVKVWRGLKVLGEI